MTLEEFGRRAKYDPRLRSHYTDAELASVPDREMALKYLGSTPELWPRIDMSIRQQLAEREPGVVPQAFLPQPSPGVQRIEQLRQRGSEARWGLFKSEDEEIANRSGHIRNNEAEADSMVRMETSINQLGIVETATKLGVPVGLFVQELQNNQSLRFEAARMQLELSRQQAQQELQLRHERELMQIRIDERREVSRLALDEERESYRVGRRPSLLNQATAA